MAKTHFVAKSIVIDAAGNFLLLTRSETHPALAGLYDLPGGMVEDKEEPGDAVKREIFEETGIVASEVKILYATTMLIDASSYPTLLYYVKLYDIMPQVKLSWEHSSFQWAGLDKLGEVEPQIAPTYGEALRYIQDNNIFEDID